MDRFCHRLARALLIMLGCAMAVAAQSPADDKAGESNTRGKITGHVVNESGQPMPNVAVTLRGYGASEVRTTVATDGEGHFEVADLPPIAYLVSARALAYVARPRDPDVNPVGYYRIGDSARLEMMKGGVITGAVKRSNGEPVVSVSVRAYLVRDFRGQRPPYSTPSIDVRTDDRGIYRIYGLAPGTYIVAAGGGSSWGYEVDPFVSDVPTYAPSSTRDTATEFTIVAGDETANVDIRYRDEPGHLVSGKVTGVEQEAGSDVRLNSVLNGIEQPAYETFQSGVARGFMFSGVADGDYDIVATNYSAGGWLVSESRRIKVQGGDITKIELNVMPLASINGIVLLEDSRATECQGKRRPLFGEIVVGAYHNEKKTPKDQPQFLWGLGGPVTPDGQGTFTLRSLAAGQYLFVTRPMAKYWYLKSISWPNASRAAQTHQPPDAARNWTTIRTGDKFSGLAITFAAGAGSIDGRVEPHAGQRLARTFVYLAPAEADKRDDVLRYFASLAAEDGAFALTNVPPGRYWILAKQAPDTETNVMTRLRIPDEGELRARILQDAETEKTQSELKPCQNLTEYRLPFHPR